MSWRQFRDELTTIVSSVAAIPEKYFYPFLFANGNQSIPAGALTGTGNRYPNQDAIGIALHFQNLGAVGQFWTARLEQPGLFVEGNLIGFC